MKRCASTEGLDARFDEGDAEALSYDDASFDLVITLFGAMFAPRPDRVAAELLCVCCPGGCIVVGSWTPESHAGQLFKTIGKDVPPSPLTASPVLWGDDRTVRERLQSGSASLVTSRRHYPMQYAFAPADVVEFFRTNYGPTNRTFAALDTEKQAALRNELTELWDVIRLP